MGDHLVRAEEFEKKAEKKLNGWGLFGSKYEDAADLLEKAANSYKLAKSCNFHTKKNVCFRVFDYCFIRLVSWIFCLFLMMRKKS